VPDVEADAGDGDAIAEAPGQIACRDQILARLPMEVVGPSQCVMHSSLAEDHRLLLSSSICAARGASAAGAVTSVSDHQM
jgi:hypothetical protein